MAKYIKHNVVEEHIDQFTGEIISTKIEKVVAIKSAEDFVMTFVESLPLTSQLSEAGLKTLLYAVLYSNYAGNPPIGNVFYFNAVVAESMTNALGIGVDAIKKSLKKLTELTLLIKDKKCKGIYYVNPLYFWKGKLSDRLKSVDVCTKYIVE